MFKITIRINKSVINWDYQKEFMPQNINLEAKLLEE